jgi:hypothetical protein
MNMSAFSATHGTLHKTRNRRLVAFAAALPRQYGTTGQGKDIQKQNNGGLSHLYLPARVMMFIFIFGTMIIGLYQNILPGHCRYLHSVRLLPVTPH